MKKIYKTMDKRNDMELKTGKASYKTLVDMYIDNRILCNNILDIDNDIWYNIIVGEIDDTTDIYQYFLVDLSDYEIESLNELNDNNDIIIAYSNVLDLYVLMVDHLGTSWDYVSTDIELTDNINEI